MTALRSGATEQTEGAPQVANETWKNNANFVWVQHFNRIQSLTLATLRDTLLPKLLSRELSVGAENQRLT